MQWSLRGRFQWESRQEGTRVPLNLLRERKLIAILRHDQLFAHFLLGTSLFRFKTFLLFLRQTLQPRRSSFVLFWQPRRENPQTSTTRLPSFAAANFKDQAPTEDDQGNTLFLCLLFVLEDSAYFPDVSEKQCRVNKHHQNTLVLQATFIRFRLVCSDMTGWNK